MLIKNICINGYCLAKNGETAHTANADGELAVDTESRIPNCVGGQ